MHKYISLTVILGIVYAAPEEYSRNPICTSGSGYYPVEGNCDSYIECINNTPRKMMCPDGLHYNSKVEWPAYPCGYPMDVPCQGRGVPQPAQPTADCPHQYGFFPSPSADAIHCGSYRMCVEGKPIDMQCPPGLAFNPDNGRCDWPDLVPSCNAEQFLGFECPPAPLDNEGNPVEVVNYAYKGNCFAFYSCNHGHPRYLVCDQGYAFDAAKGHCADNKEVQCVVPLTQH